MKRLTDTEKWRDVWFRKLSPEMKCFWDFICDNCDNAGIWKVDKDSAEFHINKKLKWDKVKENFKDRIWFIDDKKWYIKKFIKFQCGTEYMSINSHPHKKIIGIIKEHKLNGIIMKDNKILDYPTIDRVTTLQEREEEIEREKEVEIEEEEEREEEKVSNYITEIYPNYSKIVKISKTEYNKLVGYFGIDGVKKRIENLYLYVGSKGKKYKSHYLTILSWERKNNPNFESKITVMEKIEDK